MRFPEQRCVRPPELGMRRGRKAGRKKAGGREERWKEGREEGNSGTCLWTLDSSAGACEAGKRIDVELRHGRLGVAMGIAYVQVDSIAQ